MPADHLHLLVKGTPVLSPDQTVNWLYYELQHGSSDGIQWRQSWLLDTDSTVDRTDVEPFLRGDDPETADDVTYWVGVERRDDSVCSEADVKRAFDRYVTKRTESRWDGAPSVSRVVSRPGLVLGLITCPVSYAPWVVGDWLKRATQRAVGEEGAALERRWHEDCHVSTDEEGGADAIEEHVHERRDL